MKSNDNSDNDDDNGTENVDDGVCVFEQAGNSSSRDAQCTRNIRTRAQQVSLSSLALGIFTVEQRRYVENVQKKKAIIGSGYLVRRSLAARV